MVDSRGWRWVLALVVSQAVACGNLGFKCDNQTDCVDGYVCDDHMCRDPSTVLSDAGTASATSGPPSSQQGSSSVLSSSGPRPSSSSAAPGSSAFPSSSASASSAAPSSSRASSSLMGTSSSAASSSEMPDAGPCSAPCPGATVCVAPPGEAARCECPSGTTTCGGNVCAPAGGCCVPGDDTPCITGVCVGANDGGAFCVGNACQTPGTMTDMLSCTAGAPGVACCGSGLGTVTLTRTGCSPPLSPQCMWFAKDGDGAFVLTGSTVFSDVAIGTSVRLTVAPWDGVTGGRLELVSTGAITLGLAGSIDVSGRGYGGGGGGGGNQYTDTPICGAGPGGTLGGAPDGESTSAPAISGACGSYQNLPQASGGGRGGGLGGVPGQPGFGVANCYGGSGNGGPGGGLWGGHGGVGGNEASGGNVCVDHIWCDATPHNSPQNEPAGPTARRAADGQQGGYQGTATNGDLSTGDEVWMGSGGGGGAGGASSVGFCCGGAEGGRGGVAGGASTAGCVGGSGGGGGAAGGGIIMLSAKTVSIDGELNASGAGQASLGAGYGAGGGIVIKARQSLYVGTFGRITSLGGAGAGELGTNTNGGTVKLSAPDVADVPLVRVHAGRVMTF